MPDLRSSPPSDEFAPGSGAPTVASTPPASTSSGWKFPYWISVIGCLGLIGFVVMRLTMPPRDVAAECLHAALVEKGLAVTDLSVEAEIVTQGKLDVAGRRSTDIARGLLSDPIRRGAIQRCRAVYVQRMGISAGSPPLQVETGDAHITVERMLERGGSGRLEVHYPVSGARVSVENLLGQGSCVTSGSGQCELTLQHLAHDAKLSVVAKLPNGAVVSRSTTVLALLQHGLTLEALERAPAITMSIVSCQDRSALTGVIVTAEAVGATLWSTECGPTRPEQPERCRDMLGRHGDVSFHYDTRPEQLTVTLIPPGEGERETQAVALGAQDTVELTYGPCPPEQPPPAVDCQATRRTLEDHAALTRVPAGTWGHELDVLVEVMSSGIVSDIQPVAEGDPKALAALRLQLARSRGLPGPCRDLPVSLHY